MSVPSAPARRRPVHLLLNFRSHSQKQQAGFSPNIGSGMFIDVDAPGLKPVYWVGSSLEDLRGFPEPVRRSMGYALFAAQNGHTVPNARPMKGITTGAGVLQIADRHAGDSYRAVYAVNLPGAVYVLHAFQKKSPSGVRTTRRDVELIRRRLLVARNDYRSRTR